FNFLLPIEYSKPPPFLPVIVHHKIQYLQDFPLDNLGRNILPLDQDSKIDKHKQNSRHHHLLR
ncbi:hypothetical protein, partial [Streptococcus pneumoniae]|uniref:hypothetical protein n=1 Tax=Streptococcus pneumoniae TaxID=1313 RepID=UPI001D171D3C